MRGGRVVAACLGLAAPAVGDAAQDYALQPFVRQQVSAASCASVGGCGCAGKPGQRPYYFYKPGLQDTRLGQVVWFIVLTAGTLCVDDACDTTTVDPFYSWPDSPSPDIARAEEDSSKFGGALSSDRDINNAFYSYNKVWFPDCTQDLWVGKNTATGQAGRHNLLALLADLQDPAQLTVAAGAASGPATPLTKAGRVFLAGEGMAGFAVLSLWEVVNRTLQPVSPDWMPRPVMLVVSGGWLAPVVDAAPVPPATGYSASCRNCPSGQPVEWKGADNVWRMGSVVGLASGATDWTQGPWRVVLRDGAVVPSASTGSLRSLKPLMQRIQEGVKLGGKWKLVPADWPEHCRWEPALCGSAEHAIQRTGVPLLVVNSLESPLLAWHGAGVDLTNANQSDAKREWAKSLHADLYESFHRVGAATADRSTLVVLGVKCAIDRLLSTSAFTSLILNLGETIAQEADRWAVGIGARFIDWDDCAEMGCNPRCRVVMKPEPPTPPPVVSNDPLPVGGVVLALLTAAVIGCCCFWSAVIYPNRRQRMERESALERTRHVYENTLKEWENEDRAARARARAAQKARAAEPMSTVGTESAVETATIATSRMVGSEVAYSRAGSAEYMSRHFSAQSAPVVREASAVLPIGRTRRPASQLPPLAPAITSPPTGPKPRHTPPNSIPGFADYAALLPPQSQDGLLSV
eukprot:TRINITY_DN21498_c0_g1_i2.p1 TRINITY_DN21498_c0_g1~~TRINITY_DN21498_c0_g1_i2.p1  ORF type:complete len:691 (+),score=155.91 TRINITY_DN21498_c0_g1_i2:63-2135(+)